MSTSTDLREALRERLKRMETASAMRITPSAGPSITNPALGRVGGSSLAMAGNSFNAKPTSSFQPTLTNSKTTGVLPVASRLLEESDSHDNVPVVPSIRCEGYLSKYSSGSLTGRWQRRYFVLYGGRLGYFKKQPPGDSRDSKPEKSFSLRKVKEVVWNESSANEREFSITLGEATYQLKASTPSEMRKWVSALNTALAQKDSFPATDDEGGSSSAADMASVSNSVSSQASDTSMLTEDIQAYLQQQRAMAAASARKQETVWEVELDPDEIDKLFIEWFTFSDDDDLTNINSKLVTGISLALSHLYATIASEMFDAAVIDLPGQFKRANSVMQSLRRETRALRETDPIRTQFNGILMEYVPRLINEVGKFLDLRKELRDSAREDDSGTDLIPLIDTLSLAMSDISALASKTDCECAYCSATAGSSDACTASERWKKSLRNCLQRLGSEFEVALIERIQSRMLPTDSTWDAPAGFSSSAPNKTTHPLFGTRLSVWLTAWAPTLATACQSEALAVLKYEAKIKHSKRLMSELVSSVLVAVLNSAWRQFKRRTVKLGYIAQQRKDVLKQISMLKDNAGFWSLFSNQAAQIQILEKIIASEELCWLEASNLTAFGNEAVLMSLFLSETIPEQVPFVPKIFESCFEGLSVTFTNTASEVAEHLVHFHFSEPRFSEMAQSFKSADIHKTPMIVARDATEKFANDLVPAGAHPALKAQVVSKLPAAVILMYVSGLLKAKPRPVKQGRDPVAMIEADLIIFKSLFSESRFNCREAAVSKASGPLALVLAFLTEANKHTLTEELAKKLLATFGPRHAPLAANALMEMRGYDLGKTDRNAILKIVDPSLGGTVPIPETNTDSNDPETLWRF